MYIASLKVLHGEGENYQLALEAGAGFVMQVRLCGVRAESMIILHCSLQMSVADLLQ